MLSRSDANFPDAYELAGFIGRRIGARTIIDIGIGAPSNFISLEGFKKIGRGSEPSVARLREQLPQDNWRSVDLECDENWALDLADLAESIVISCHFIESAIDPSRLLRRLASLARSALATIVVVSHNVSESETGASPVGAGTAQSWTVECFRDLLRRCGIVPAFVGRTRVHQNDVQRSAIIAIIDHYQSKNQDHVPETFRPLAVIQTYNEIDIAPQVIQKLLADNFDVHVRDNWSSDGTFEALMKMADRNRAITLRRFPDDGPSRYYDHEATLRWKEDVAAQNPGRWIIAQDSDEVRCSPWPNVSFRGGLYIADQSGFTAVDFTVVNFLPCNDQFRPGDDPEKALTRFEFWRQPGYLQQIRAWRQPPTGVDLVPDAGHMASFSGRRVFPYKFLLKHYPLRTPKQAYRKIFRERLPRYKPENRAKGWHVHYNHFEETDGFLWKADDLHEFDVQTVREKFTVELISGIGIIPFRNTERGP